MNEYDDYRLPSPFRLALIGCISLVVGMAALVAIYWPDLPDWFTRIAYGLTVLFWGIPIVVGVVCLGAFWVAVNPVVVIPEVGSRPEPKRVPVQTREEAAREFWIMACKVAKATGRPGWRKGYENFLSSYSDWEKWIKTPFVDAGMAIPFTQHGHTTIIWREGVSPDYLLGWLAGNLPTLPQEGWPPKWRKPQTADTGNTGKQADYAAQ